MASPTLADKTIVERKGDDSLDRQSSGHAQHTLSHEIVGIKKQPATTLPLSKTFVPPKAEPDRA